ncbi:MAG: hypothetical protein GC157_11305 [Frankiales bacterium]|nr:hypothetical protein [Frankiales bacterium]
MSATPSQVVDQFLGAVTGASIPECSVWAQDAVLDATVPNWRFRVVGPDAIRAEYRGWFADPGELDELERHPVPGGEVVRYLLRCTEDGVPHVAHHVHVLEIGDGLVRRDTVVCGGRWPQSLQDEMAEAQAAADAAVDAS